MPRLRLLKGQLSLTTHGEMIKLADKFLKEVRGHISKQDLNLPELAEATKRMKGSSKWWEESKYFQNHLMYESKVTPKMFIIRVGALDTIPYPARQNITIKTMYDLAIRLERGWGKIPARPLFQKTYDGMKKEINDVEKKLNMKFQGMWK